MADARQNTIMAQSAAKVAADLTNVALTTDTPTDIVLDAWREIRDSVLGDFMEVAAQEGTTPSAPSFGGGNASAGGDFVIDFGKHKGLTVSEIAKKDAKYVDWLADKSTNANVREAIKVFKQG